MFSLRNGLSAKILLTSVLMASALSAAELQMATTTSTDNTGLLDVIAPEYKKDTGVDLKWVAVGTGNALKLGENCDVSVVFVHSPKAEINYVEKGFGVDRTPVMFNDFVIVGDPKYKYTFENKNIYQAFEEIQKDKLKFISRGDKSGTDNKEKSVWKETIGYIPEKQDWYVESGQGMIATINIAQEQKGLTLTDRGTFIKYEANHKGNPPLVIVLEGDEQLKNFYSVMAVSPKNCKNTDYEGAKKFINWIVSDKGQELVGDFKLMGKQLFTPDANTRGK